MSIGYYVYNAEYIRVDCSKDADNPECAFFTDMNDIARRCTVVNEAKVMWFKLERQPNNELAKTVEKTLSNMKYLDALKREAAAKREAEEIAKEYKRKYGELIRAPKTDSVH